MPICARCGEENAAVARFCQACGAPLTAIESRQERKVLTVLFADLVGFTSRSDGSDPDLLGRDGDFVKLRLEDASPWRQAAAEFARGDFAAAAERYAAFGAHLYEAESRLRLGEQLAAAGRSGEADRESAAARAFFERAGAPGRASGELRAVGGP